MESFAIFKLPGNSSLLYCEGDLKKFNPPTEIDSDLEGFLISPWPTKNDFYLIHGPFEEIENNKVETILLNKKLSLLRTLLNSVSFVDFEKEVLGIQREISLGNVEKIVAARFHSELISMSLENVSKWFLKLLNEHKNSFVSLIYTPDFGLWIGATPETLISFEGQKVATMSLAGTLFNSTDSWTEKEKLEQTVTTKFIREILRKYSLNEIKSTIVQESFSGELRHLKSGFETTVKLEEVFQLIADLSPTPAVAGYPQAKSIDWLKSNEIFDRQLYSGFLGPIKKGKIDLFVNLRCAQITENQVLYYAGCGINAGSDVNKEWNETDAKMNVIRKFTT